MDATANLAYTTVATAPSPASSGTALTVPFGHGIRFPAPPFNAVVCAANEIPIVTNAEIVRVTARTADTLTITRAQEGTPARAIVVGDQIYAGITKLLLDQLAGWSAIGLPQSFPYNAANFTTLPATTWTVPSGGYSLTYNVVGKLCFVNLGLGGTTTTGSPTNLLVVMPITPAATGGLAGRVVIAGASESAPGLILANDPKLYVTRNGGAAFNGTVDITLSFFYAIP